MSAAKRWRERSLKRICTTIPSAAFCTLTGEACHAQNVSSLQDPKYVYAYNNWGNALLDLNRPEEEIARYQKAIELEPKFAGAYHNWGITLRELNRPNEAREKFKKAHELDPEKFPAP